MRDASKRKASHPPAMELYHLKRYEEVEKETRLCTETGSPNRKWWFHQNNTEFPRFPLGPPFYHGIPFPHRAGKIYHLASASDADDSPRRGCMHTSAEREKYEEKGRREGHTSTHATHSHGMVAVFPLCRPELGVVDAVVDVCDNVIFTKFLFKNLDSER